MPCQSIFFINNLTEKHVSFGEHNFEALKTTDKQFVRVNNAGHFDLHQKGGLEYWQKMKTFIQTQTY